MTDVLWWAQTILTVIEVTGAFWCAGAVFEEKRAGAGKWFSGLGIILLTGLTVYQRTFVMYSRWWLVITIFSGGLFLLIDGRKKKRPAWTFLALYFETIYCMDIFWYLAGNVIHPGNDPLAKLVFIGSERIIIFLLTRSIMAAGCVFLYQNRGKTAYYLEAGRRLWWLVILIEHFCLICCDRIFVSGNEKESFGGWRVLLVFYPVLLILVLFYFIQQKYRRMYEYMELQNALYGERYKAMDEKSREKERIYHDLKNHMILLQKMINDGDADRANAYIHELFKGGDEGNVESEIGVPLLDYLVQVKMAEASQKQILVEGEYEGKMDEPGQGELADWCALIGNLWDNALEGCERIEKERWIRFSFRNVGNAVTIKLENSCHPDVNVRRLATTKADWKNHGLGVENIEFIVNKYGGRVKRDCRNGRFVTKITLILP